MSLLLAILLVLGFESSYAQQNKLYDYFRTIENGKIVSNGVFREKAPRVQDIQNSLSKFSSDADVLSYLLKSYPHLKNNFVLVHKTESQQLSSLTHPRIIFFGGGTAFAFSESPLQRDRRVEILTTDPQTFDVSLHEITFDQGKARLESNPKACLACHGSPSRALWNPYDFWPNTFGSAIGNYGTTGEAEAYKKLKAKAPQSQLLSKINLPQKYGLDSEAVTAFTIYISGLNQGRWIAQNLKKGSSFDKIAKPFIAVVGRCMGDSNHFNSKPSVEGMKKVLGPEIVERNLATLNELIKDEVAARDHFRHMLDRQHLSIFPDPHYLMNVDHSRLADEALWIAYMRWVLSMAGIDSRDLSASLFGNDTLLSSPGNFLAEFTTALFELRPDLFKDFQYRSYDFVPKSSIIIPDCESLLNAIKKEKPAQLEESHFVSFREDVATRPVLSRCSKCHSEGLGNSFVDVPYLPFNDSSLLAQILRAPNSKLKDKIETRIRSVGAGQMPPGKGLSEEEIQSLLSYLDNLK